MAEADKEYYLIIGKRKVVEVRDDEYNKLEKIIPRIDGVKNDLKDKIITYDYKEDNLEVYKIPIDLIGKFEEEEFAKDIGDIHDYDLNYIEKIKKIEKYIKSKNINDLSGNEESIGEVNTDFEFFIVIQKDNDVYKILYNKNQENGFLLKDELTKYKKNKIIYTSKNEIGVGLTEFYNPRRIIIPDKNQENGSFGGFTPLNNSIHTADEFSNDSAYGSIIYSNNSALSEAKGSIVLPSKLSVTDLNEAPHRGADLYRYKKRRKTPKNKSSKKKPYKASGKS
jgi:hypothetical protein